MNYNFKNFFKETSIQYDEYISNGHILIKKSCLKKPQFDLTKDFPQSTEQQARVFSEILKRECKKEIIKDFSPILIKEVTQRKKINGKDVTLKYNIVISELDNNSELATHSAIQEEYYNFIQDIKCSVKIVNKNQFNPFMIYNANNEVIGVVMPCSMINIIISECQDYQEYLSNFQAAKENKDLEHKNKVNNIKKCLYISNNKAIIRNKELICISDIVNDEAYKNLYVEADYKNNFGEIFIKFNFIFYGIGRTIDKANDIEQIKYTLENSIKHTFADYELYIDKCLNNNQFINVAEIKLMELAGKTPEYVQQLTDHRQKVLDERDQNYKDQEAKRQKEEREFLELKNKIVIDTIEATEQAIRERKAFKNIDITIYKESRYNSKDTSIVNHLMKLYNINIPLKTQGWINKALASIFYDDQLNQWTYNFYTSSANSTVFMGYLKEMIGKINKKEVINCLE